MDDCIVSSVNGVVGIFECISILEPLSLGDIAHVQAARGSFRQGDNGGMVKILANVVRKSAALGL